MSYCPKCQRPRNQAADTACNWCGATLVPEIPKPCPLCGEPLDAEGHDILKAKPGPDPLAHVFTMLNADFYHEKAASNVSNGRWAKQTER